MNKTVSKQMDTIHSMARRRTMRWFKWLSIVLSAALAIAGLYTQKQASSPSIERTTERLPLLTTGDVER